MVGRQLTPEDVERLARGQLHLAPRERWSPYPSLKLSRADMAAFQETKKKGYLIWRKHQGILYEIYWRWCNATGQPFLAAKIYDSSCAFVELVCDLDTELSEEGIRAIHRVFWGRTLENKLRVHRWAICAVGIHPRDVERTLLAVQEIARQNTRPFKA